MEVQNALYPKQGLLRRLVFEKLLPASCERARAYLAQLDGTRRSARRLRRQGRAQALQAQRAGRGGENMNHTMPLMFAKPSRVLLVEDDLRLQTGIRDAILSAATCELVAVCSSRHEALRIIESTPVDIALISLSLGDGSGLDVVQAVKQFQPHSEVLVMGTADDKEDIFLSLEVGATACLLKEDFSRPGRLRISSSSGTVMVSQIRGNTPDTDADVQVKAQVDELSPMQKRILCCLADGLSNKEIARHLLLSPYNVDYHLKRLRRRFSVHNRVQLISAALTLFQD